MTAIDDVLQACAGYADQFPAGRPASPARRLAVLTCMDARLDPAAAFGLDVGDAHVIRNAGGLVTDDALRSLAIGQRALGTTQVLLVQHTGCGMNGFDDGAFRAHLTSQTGAAPTWDVPGFADVAESVRQGLATLRECPWLPSRDAVRGAVFDVGTGRLSEID